MPRTRTSPVTLVLAGAMLAPLPALANPLAGSPPPPPPNTGTPGSPATPPVGQRDPMTPGEMRPPSPGANDTVRPRAGTFTPGAFQEFQTRQREQELQAQRERENRAIEEVKKATAPINNLKKQIADLQADTITPEYVALMAAHEAIYRSEKKQEEEIDKARQAAARMQFIYGNDPTPANGAARDAANQKFFAAENELGRLHKSNMETLNRLREASNTASEVAARIRNEKIADLQAQINRILSQAGEQATQTLIMDLLTR